MFTRWIYIALLIALIVPLAAVGVNADTGHDVICGDLAESDCQILQDNKAAMAAVSSFMFDMAMTLDLAHESAQDSDIALNLAMAAQGSLSASPEALAGLMELEDQMENSAGLSMSEAELAQVDAFIAGLTGEITADINLVADGETTDMALHMLMQDGVFAFSAGALEELMGQPMEGMDWIGLDANGMLTLLASDPEMGAMLGMGADEGSHADADTWSDLEEAATSVTRLADSEINGLAVAVFESTVDMSLIADMAMGLFDDSDAIDQAEKDAMQESLHHATLTMRQSIGLSDHYTYRTELSMGSGSADAQAAGQGERGISMGMTLEQSHFNQPVEVAIPEEAFILPLAMLMQMGSN